MKLYFLSIVLILSMASVAQVTGVSLKASGLTCSMCSNAINKALKTLDFVEKVEANIKDYSFEISFKAGYPVDFNRIKKKVEEAGFSVAGFIAAIQLPTTNIKAGGTISIGNISLCFLKATTLPGTAQVKIVNKGFIPPKEYKRIKLPELVAASGTYYALIN